jgi:hypothetical protein
MEVAKLRVDEPGLPRFIDPTRPVSTARSYRTRQPTVRMIDHRYIDSADGP